MRFVYEASKAAIRMVRLSARRRIGSDHYEGQWNARQVHKFMREFGGSCRVCSRLILAGCGRYDLANVLREVGVEGAMVSTSSTLEVAQHPIDNLSTERLVAATVGSFVTSFVGVYHFYAVSHNCPCLI